MSIEMSLDHPDVQFGLAHLSFDAIFFGHLNNKRADIPFGYNGVPLNGTKTPPNNPDSNVYSGTRFGVFVNPWTPQLYRTLSLVTDDHPVLEEADVLRMVDGSTLTEYHSQSQDSSVGCKIPVKRILSEFRSSRALRYLPIAVISSWYEGSSKTDDEQICMHFPEVAVPGSILGFMKTVAERQRLVLETDAALPVVRASVLDGTTDFHWATTR